MHSSRPGSSKPAGLRGHLLAQFAGRIHLVGVAQAIEQQPAQVIDHLAGKLARVAAAVQGRWMQFQPGCGVAVEDRIHQGHHRLAGGRAQHRLGSAPG